MAKKPKDEAPNPNGVANRDIIQRLNFLYQASAYLNSVSPAGTSSLMTRPTEKKIRKRTAQDLAKTYITSMKAVGQKTTVKLFVTRASYYYIYWPNPESGIQ